MRNAGEFRWPIIVCIAIFGGSSGGVWLVIFWECWRVAGCVLQWRKLACSRRVLMVSVGVGVGVVAIAPPPTDVVVDVIVLVVVADVWRKRDSMSV